MAIEMHLSQVSAAPGKDFAEVTWNGKKFTEGSLTSVMCKMARTLVNAGCPDQEIRAFRNGRFIFSFPSLHVAAGLTITHEPVLKMQKFVDLQALYAAEKDDEDGGGNGDEADEASEEGAKRTRRRRTAAEVLSDARAKQAVQAEEEARRLAKIAAEGPKRRGRPPGSKDKGIRQVRKPRAAAKAKAPAPLLRKSRKVPKTKRK